MLKQIISISLIIITTQSKKNDDSKFCIIFVLYEIPWTSWILSVLFTIPMLRIDLNWLRILRIEFITILKITTRPKFVLHSKFPSDCDILKKMPFGYNKNSQYYFFWQKTCSDTFDQYCNCPWMTSRIVLSTHLQTMRVWVCEPLSKNI